VQLTLTAGVPATTGSQLTPATPAGQIALYTITVAFGASTVTAANITKVAGAPFLGGSILSKIGNFQGFVNLSGAATLTASQSGSFVELGNASAYTVTLPSPATPNLRFAFYNASANANTISTPTGVIANANVGAASLSIASGSSIDMVSDGNNWIVLSGAGAASLGASGYQKFPSGLIIQWGTVATTNGSGTVVFPIAFPTVLRAANVSEWNGAGGWTNTNASFYGVYGNSATGFSVRQANVTGGAMNVNGSGTASWFAIGQ
jgi:hypothetical protein